MKPRPQFRLRSLFILTAVLGMALAPFKLPHPFGLGVLMLYGGVAFAGFVLFVLADLFLMSKRDR
jgi:hypothetical protein